MSSKILSLNNLEVKFQVRQKFLTAIRNVSLDIYDQEILAIVGESGSGKSVITKTFTGMLESNGFISEGSIIYYPNLETNPQSYFKEPIDLVSLQKNIVDKYTIKSIVKSLNFELKENKKKKRHLKNLNLNNLNKKYDVTLKKIEAIKIKETDFNKKNKFQYKKSSIINNLNKIDQELKYINDLNFKSELNDRLEEEFFNLKVNKRKIKNPSLISKYRVWSTISFLKKIIEFYKLNKEDQSIITEILFLNYKKSIVSEIIKKFNNFKDMEFIELYLKNTFEDFYKEIYKKDLNLERLKNLLIKYDKDIKTFSNNKNYLFLLKNNIYKFLKFYSFNFYNFEIEIKIESYIKNMFINKTVSEDEFSFILESWSNWKKLKLVNKIKSIKSLRNLRGKTIASIFQDPMTSLNPLLSVGFQISEVLRKKLKYSRKKAKEEAIKLLEKVGIQNAKKRYKDIPGQYSGGMRQRVVIAIALASRPNILICDEPTTALDVTIQAQILDLIKELQEEYKFTVVFITHDLGVVAKLADRVAVMYAGQIIEYGLTDEIFHNPKHPYTWSLLSSLPQLGEKGKELYSIKGSPPSLFKKVVGDAFALRSDYSLEVDKFYEPPVFKISETHFAKTWLLDERAPKTEKPEALNNLKSKIED